jgi:hypothetical protein
MTESLQHRLHHPHPPVHDVPDEHDPSTLPVEPDEGPEPDRIPEDPEHERIVDPTSTALPLSCHSE